LCLCVFVVKKELNSFGDRVLKKRTGLLLVGLAYLSFISLGLPDGLLGVAWPSIRASFKLPLDALGALLVMFTAGYLISSFSSGRLLERINVGTLLALSCLATAISLLGYSSAPVWWVMVLLGLLAGLGAGAIDAGLNTYAATHFSARMMNWLHAFYGIGATLGPMIMTGVLDAGRPWQWGYAIVGIGQLVLAGCFGLTHRLWKDDRSSRENNSSAAVEFASSGSTLRLPIVWLSVAVFFIYTGIEAGAGAWAYSLFTEARGISASTAGVCISVYWGSLTAGRLLSGLVVGFTRVQLLLRYCIIALAIGAALLWLNPANSISFLGLTLMGLGCAPVFPSLIATTPGRLSKAHTANGIGFQIAGAVLGQSLLPALLGLLAGRLGLEVIGPALFAATVLLLCLFEALMAKSSKITRDAHALNF
jgi:fucose permease